LKRMTRLAFGLSVLALISAPAAYSGTVYATGFENPPFTLGNLVGQDGWTEFGSAITTVEDFNVFAGSQAVFVDGSGAGQSGPYRADSPTGPLIDLSAEIYISSSSSEGSWQFAATGPDLTGFIGGIDLVPDASIPALDDIELITGNLPIIATTFSLNTWNDVDFLFNMTTQTYNFSLNGSLVQSGVAFCGNNSFPCNGATVPSYADSFFDVFGGTGGNNDSGYLDNFSLADVSGVPEPASLLLFGSGLTLLIGGKLVRR